MPYLIFLNFQVRRGFQNIVGIWWKSQVVHTRIQTCLSMSDELVGNLTYLPARSKSLFERFILKKTGISEVSWTQERMHQAVRWFWI